jgi:cholesterol transport system auxiliary component
MKVMVSLLCLLLTGCVGLASKPPLQIVAGAELLRSEPAATPKPRIDRQLTVALPSAMALLDGERVVARHGAGELAYLAGVAFPDNAPRLLQDGLIEALQRTGFGAVERQGSGLRGDLSITLQLQRFEVDYSDSERPRGRIELQALLIDSRSGRALDSRRFEAAEAVAGDSAADGARALLSGSVRVLAEIAGWTAERVEVAAAAAADSSQ